MARRVAAVRPTSARPAVNAKALAEADARAKRAADCAIAADISGATHQAASDRVQANALARTRNAVAGPSRPRPQPKSKATWAAQRDSIDEADNDKTDNARLRITRGTRPFKPATTVISTTGKKKGKKKGPFPAVTQRRR
jgi:hypothetical protein